MNKNKRMAANATKNNDKAATDMQRHAFQLTINNPKEHGFDHLAIKKTLIDNFPTIRFFCMADEVGLEEHTPHTHVYVTFTSRVRFSTLKKHFPPAHILVAAKSTEENINYIKKSGKWADSEKSKTSIPGTYEEWGTPPVQKGKRMDMEELYQMIENGYSTGEILRLNNDYILNIDKIDKVRTTLLIEKYKGERRLDLRVTYISGVTGKGKTRDVLDTYGDYDTYRVTGYKNPFDHYGCQSSILFEEFRSQLPLSDMLNYLDVYPIILPARYSDRYACYHNVCIASNWRLEEQYRNIQEEDPASWKAFLRRIHEVKVYNSDGTITEYASVDEYMNEVEKERYRFNRTISNDDFFQLMPVRNPETTKEQEDSHA